MLANGKCWVVPVGKRKQYFQQRKVYTHKSNLPNPNYNKKTPNRLTETKSEKSSGQVTILGKLLIAGNNTLAYNRTLSSTQTSCT